MNDKGLALRDAGNKIEEMARQECNAKGGVFNETTMTCEMPKNYLAFDGKNVSWMRDGKNIKGWKAMSGKSDYQSAEYQNIKGKGPLPEGIYSVPQREYQNLYEGNNWEDTKRTNSLLHFKSKWPGSSNSWGRNRVWLKPSSQNNMYNRNKFSIHGGKNYGSSGCVDLSDGMNDFTKDYLKYGKDLNLHVKYPKGW